MLTPPICNPPLYIDITFEPILPFPFLVGFGIYLGHRVAMSVCVCVCLRHWVQFFPRPLIGLEITLSVPGLSLVDPTLKKKIRTPHFFVLF